MAGETTRLSISVNRYLTRAGFDTYGSENMTAFGTYYIDVRENPDADEFLTIRVSDHEPARKSKDSALYLYTSDHINSRGEWVEKLYNFIKENGKEPCRYLKAKYKERVKAEEAKRDKIRKEEEGLKNFKDLENKIKEDYKKFLVDNGFKEKPEEAAKAAANVDSFKFLSDGVKKTIRRELRASA